MLCDGVAACLCVHIHRGFHNIHVGVVGAGDRKKYYENKLFFRSWLRAGTEKLAKINQISVEKTENKWTTKWSSVFSSYWQYRCSRRKVFCIWQRISVCRFTITSSSFTLTTDFFQSYKTFICRRRQSWTLTTHQFVKLKAEVLVKNSKNGEICRQFVAPGINNVSAERGEKRSNIWLCKKYLRQIVRSTFNQRHSRQDSKLSRHWDKWNKRALNTQQLNDLKIAQNVRAHGVSEDRRVVFCTVRTEPTRCIYTGYNHTKNNRKLPCVRVQHCSYPPGTSVSSVRPCHNCRDVCEFCNTTILVPETSRSFARIPYPYSEFTNPTEHNLGRSYIYTSKYMSFHTLDNSYFNRLSDLILEAVY